MNDEETEYYTGDFCRHYANNYECDEVCACGHLCKNHSWYTDDRECSLADCDCEKFQDVEV